MQKILVLLFTLLALISPIHAQQMEHKNKKKPRIIPKNTWSIETNVSNAIWTQTEFVRPSTGVGMSTADEEFILALGAEGAYFVLDNLALKLGFGVNLHSVSRYLSTTFSYRVGAKYYAWRKFPIQTDISGAAERDAGGYWFWGIRMGYAFFLALNIAIEPSIRYNAELNVSPINYWEGHIAFSLFLNRKQRS